MNVQVWPNDHSTSGTRRRVFDKRSAPKLFGRWNENASQTNRLHAPLSILLKSLKIIEIVGINLDFFSLKPPDLFLRQKETPVIKGLRTSYRVGDLLNVNCSTSARDAQLKWYLNDEPISSSFLIPYTGLHQPNQSNSANQVASLYESLPHQLSNVYYNNGLVAHALKRRTFSIQNTFTAAATADAGQRVSGGRRSLASNGIGYHSAYAHLNHHPSLSALASLNNGLLDENQILGLQMPLQQQHFQVDVKLKCVAIMYKQVSGLMRPLRNLQIGCPKCHAASRSSLLDRRSMNQFLVPLRIVRNRSKSFICADDSDWFFQLKPHKI